ncbi:unnamed protein product [Owenia fusiformis]|uniref:Uncharacterized protein n=1 Tax=Owenia fusiformis TaxID=6347 RepID=A0A8J1T549_OWEFU|nr:unnamed protein product [Owenia fusiformis]
MPIDDALQHGHHAINHTLEDLILNRASRHQSNDHGSVEGKHGRHRERLLNTKLPRANRERKNNKGYNKTTITSEADKVDLNIVREDLKSDLSQAAAERKRRSTDGVDDDQLQNRANMENDSVEAIDEKDTTAEAEVDNKKELLRFEKMLHTWPKDRPKSAIYYLTYSKRVPALVESIKTVDKYFNSEFSYPIIIFFNELLASDMENIRQSTESEIYFQKVSFRFSHIVQRFERVPTFSECANYTIGYRHAVRFHSYFVYKQAILKYLKYVWRIDDDAILTEKINNDPFTDMSNKNLTYKFLYKARGKYKCLVNLKRLVDTYVQKLDIKPTFLRQLHVSDIFVNSLEISATSFWTGSEYQKFFSNLDDYGMIYHASWSDAGIKTLALSVFVNEQRIEQLKIGFKHGDRKCTTSISGYGGYLCSPVKN